MSGEAFRREIQRLLCVPATVSQENPKSLVVVADCGHSVWMAPSGLQVWQTKNILALCIPCGMRDRAPGDGLRITRGQYNELCEMFGEQEAQARMDALGVTAVVDPN